MTAVPIAITIVAAMMPRQWNLRRRRNRLLYMPPYMLRAPISARVAALFRAREATTAAWTPEEQLTLDIAFAFKKVTIPGFRKALTEEDRFSIATSVVKPPEEAIARR